MCVFCAMRGCPTCLCPVSMCRKYVHDTQGSVSRMRNALGVWKNLGKVLQTVPLVGSMVYNMSKSRCDVSTMSSNVAESGVLSLNLSTTLKVTKHPCLQWHLDQPGVAHISSNATLPPSEIHGADANGSDYEQTLQSSECSPHESWSLTTSSTGNTSSATSGDWEGVVNVSNPSDIEQLVWMVDLW